MNSSGERSCCTLQTACESVFAPPQEHTQITDENGFYRYHGLCLDSYSREKLAAVMLKAMDMGLGPVAKFSGYRAYSEAIDDLFTHEGIFKAIEDATGFVLTTVGYHLDEEQLLLRLDI